jgi:hypothetical protein
MKKETKSAPKAKPIDAKITFNILPMPTEQLAMLDAEKLIRYVFGDVPKASTTISLYVVANISRIRLADIIRAKCDGLRPTATQAMIDAVAFLVWRQTKRAAERLQIDRPAPLPTPGQLEMDIISKLRSAVED